MAERLIAVVSKTIWGLRPTGVQIPLPPPEYGSPKPCKAYRALWGLFYYSLLRPGQRRPAALGRAAEKRYSDAVGKALSLLQQEYGASNGKNENRPF